MANRKKLHLIYNVEPPLPRVVSPLRNQTRRGIPVKCLTIVVYGETGLGWHLETTFNPTWDESSRQSIDSKSFVTDGRGYSSVMKLKTQTKIASPIMGGEGVIGSH